MLIDQINERWQRHLNDRLHLERLFKSEPLGSEALHLPIEREIDGSARLVVLLKGLGIGADVAEASTKRSDAAINRAAADIAGWMAYLPEDCVKAMVRDGWHWST